jgi:hypothetical protein
MRLARSVAVVITPAFVMSRGKSKIKSMLHIVIAATTPKRDLLRIAKYITFGEVQPWRQWLV